MSAAAGTAYERVIAALEDKGLTIRPSGRGVRAQCPHHEDRDPSLGVLPLPDSVSLHCFVGCDNVDIVTDLGMTMADLFDNQRNTTYAYPDGRKVTRKWNQRAGKKDFRQSDNAGTSALFRVDEVRAAVAAGKPVHLVEGEKDVQAIELAGGVATCWAGGVSNFRYADLSPLRGAHLAIVVDNDAAGRKLALEQAKTLGGQVKSLRFLVAVSGKDACDHLTAGYSLDELVPIIIGAPAADEPVVPEVWDAADLLAAHFPDQLWVVVEMIPTGLGVLSGPPKQGKSFMALRLAVNVATGTQFLGHDTTAGRVLFLALEDGARRAQRRLRMMPEHQQIKRGTLEIRTTAPRIDQGLIDDLDEWRQRPGPPPRLVIIDIFQRVRPVAAGKDRYAEDYASVAGLQHWANKHGLTVIVLHHNRKPVAGDDDPFTAVSGSTGLTGAVDLVMVLRGSRGAPEAALFITGRDVEQQELSLELNNGVWSFGSMPVELVTAPTRLRWDRDVWRYLAKSGPVSTEAVAKEFNLTEQALVKRLRRVEQSGWITADGPPSPGKPVFWEAVRDAPSSLPMESVDSVESMESMESVDPDPPLPF